MSQAVVNVSTSVRLPAGFVYAGLEWLVGPAANMSNASGLLQRVLTRCALSSASCARRG
jgi:hypothetical protein